MSGQGKYTALRGLLDGCQPRWPAPRLVASVLSRRLPCEVSVTECGNREAQLEMIDWVQRGGLPGLTDPDVVADARR